MMRRLCSKYVWHGPLRGSVYGLLWNPHAVWIGVHWSRWNRRFCVNIIPCLTMWLTLEGGNTP